MKKLYLRASVLILALLMILPLFAACEDLSPDDTDDPSSTTLPENEPGSDELVINSENAESVEMIRSDKLSSKHVIVKLYVDFRNESEKLFGKKFGAGTDFIMPGKEVDPEKIEIIIGENDREESKALNEKLKAAGKYAYGIAVTGKKIAVSGSSVYLIYKALDYILTDLVTKDENGKSVLKLADGFEYIQTAESDYPEPREIVDSGRDFAFFTLERIARIPTKGDYKTVQGGGSDGKYAYVALIDKSTTPETGIIHKFDMSTWELVATSEPMPSAHTNDITYDSKNNRLVISYCSETDGYRGIVTVNPDTLEFIEYILAPTVSRGVCYLPDRNQYVFAVNFVYYLTNDKFETIASIPDGFPNLTSQGFYCDGDLIYDPRWDSKAEYQTVSMNDMNGNFIGAIPLYDIDGEPESIFRDGNTFVMNCGKSNAFFRLAILYEDWWE